MYLELAENNNQGYYSMMAQGGVDASESYMYIPSQFTDTGEGMYVREDSFDLLPDYQFDQLQDILEPYQERGLSLFGLGKKGRARRKARREARWANKMEKMGVRTERVQVRGETGGGALGRVADAVKNIFGGGAPPEAIPVELPPAKTGIMGMPNWVLPVAGVGILITVLAMAGRERKRK